MAQARHSLLYEINTRIWLGEWAQTLGHACTLAHVPDSALDRMAELGFDWVWLLGVWQTGAAGRQVSRTYPGWRAGFEQVLPGLTDADLCGSPFAVCRYAVHNDFGGDAALRQLRERLSARGIRLMLDFVPNHTALDHPWASAHPEYYIHGSEAELARSPGNSFRVVTAQGPRVLA
ncbi:MAG TPA: alpha-amylase family glycosyl hydrolase, partial [Isosphaeraceae bacterium]|nr:alpha-amylase family glycosyl hydrolase [Isosphaeraceae bacterium]